MKRLLLLFLALALPALAQSPPLAHWRDGTTRQAILNFVQRVTTPGPGFVPVEERIATFDSDGTMICEQPLYCQFAFALDRIRQLAQSNPQGYQDVLDAPLPKLIAGGSEPLLGRAYPGLTTEEFTQVAREWLKTARHPRFQRRYPELVYEPMVELLAYLRANGFKTYLVSGGPCEWLRVWAPEAYGIPPEQVLGSSICTRFEMRGDEAVLVRTDRMDFRDERAGKPIDIEKTIGRRPILACGNSDGDLEMLQYVSCSRRHGLAVLIHHDDAEREYAYDRASAVGHLDQALDEALRRGWTVVSMKNDWTRIFAPPK